MATAQSSLTSKLFKFSLEARVALAKAKLAVNEQDRNELHEEAFGWASECALDFYLEHSTAQSAPPLPLLDYPELRQAWSDGRESAEISVAIASLDDF